MIGFDYANARLRAMKSRLLPREKLEALTDERNITAFLNALTRTPYQEAVEMTLVQYTGLVAVSQTLQLHMNGRLEKIQRFFEGKSAELVEPLWYRYDVDNIKAVLRGLTRQLPAEEILNATISRGTLNSADLAHLAQSTSARQAVDLLATWGVPMAHPLLALRVELPGAALWQMEVALEQWFFHEIESVDSKAGQALQEYMRLFADSSNILTILRLVGLEGRDAFFRQQFDATGPMPLLIGPGHLSFNLLAEATRTETIQGVVEMLGSTIYGGPLEAALVHYHSNKRISSFEKALNQMKLQQAVSFFVRNPDGIGILLGYLVLYSNEIANLLRIGQGIDLSRPAVEIRAELQFAEL